ncbi:MAG: PIN domain-containing protein [Betaproteobacteria bacterium]|uniref:PIN domain-containing protein n=1 Tax=Candidatus Proximibacter danicus TaxID=2954365 RepID=A0A9D7K0A8_9PROT|nr:PIN domain-containing protein [Candidatus Proximibacter danicus]MBK9447433.1 PIN domain-containing protein [Betaproteobacteria bacterium]
MIAYTQRCVVAPPDTRIALHAAELHRQRRLATADAVVYASALENYAELLTCDTHFDGLPAVVFVPKHT